MVKTLQKPIKEKKQPVLHKGRVHPMNVTTNANKRICAMCNRQFIPRFGEPECPTCMQRFEEDMRSFDSSWEKEHRRKRKILARDRMIPYGSDIEDEGPPLPGAVMMMLVLAMITIACFMGVIRYGITFHQDLAQQWMIVIFCGLLEHIIIIETFKILLMTYHLSFTERRIMG